MRLDPVARNKLFLVLRQGRERDGLYWPTALIALERELVKVIHAHPKSNVAIQLSAGDDQSDDGPMSAPFTYSRAAEALDCSKSTIAREVKAGTLPTVMVGKRPRIPASAIAERIGT